MNSTTKNTGKAGDAAEVQKTQAKSATKSVDAAKRTGSSGGAKARKDTAKATEMQEDATSAQGEGIPAIDEAIAAGGSAAGDSGDDDDGEGGKSPRRRLAHADADGEATPVADEADLLDEVEIDDQQQSAAGAMLDLDGSSRGADEKRAEAVDVTKSGDATPRGSVGTAMSVDEADAASEQALDDQIELAKQRVDRLRKIAEKRRRLNALEAESERLARLEHEPANGGAGSEDRGRKSTRGGRGADDDDDDDDDGDDEESITFKSASSGKKGATASASSTLQKGEKASITAQAMKSLASQIEKIEKETIEYRSAPDHRDAPKRRLLIEERLLRLEKMAAALSNAQAMTPYALAATIGILLTDARDFDASSIETVTQLSSALREALGLDVMTMQLLVSIACIDLTREIKPQRATLIRLYRVVGADEKFAIMHANAQVISALTTLDATKLAARDRRPSETDAEYNHVVLELITATDRLIVGNKLLPASSVRVATATTTTSSATSSAGRASIAPPPVAYAAAAGARISGACYQCGRRGHMARDCRNAPVARPEQKNETTTTKKPYMNAPVFCRVNVSGEQTIEVRALIDTGALPSVISPALMSRLGATLVASEVAFVVGVANENSPVLGQCAIDVEIGGRTMKIEALVVERTAFDLLIGTRSMSSVGDFTIAFGRDRARVQLDGGRWTEVDASQSESRVFHIDVMNEATQRVDRAAVAVKQALEEMTAAAPAGEPFELPPIGEVQPALEPGPALSDEQSNAFGLIEIGPALSDEIRRQVVQLNEEFRELFINKKGSRKTPPTGKNKAMTVKLLVKPGADFSNVRSGPIQMAPDKAAFMEAFAKEMLEEGKLTDDVSNCICSSAAFVVDDDGNGKFRVVINFSPLNTHLFGNAGSPPSMTSLHQFLSEGDFRSTFDLSSCFYQFPVDLASVPLLGVWFGERFLAFKCLPMGLNVSAGFVQSFVSSRLCDENVRFYVDDGGMRHRHEGTIVKDLRRLYERCVEEGVSFSATKIKIGFVELPFCGRVIGPRTIAVPEDALTAIKDLGRPRNVSQLRSFLGVINAVSAHVPGVNFVLQPLFAAVAASRAGVALLWSDDMVTSFEEAKRLVATPELLTPLDDKRPLILMTDWSVIGRSIVFAHLSHDGKRFDYVRIITRNHTAAEKNHSAARGELDSLRIARKLCPELTEGRLLYWATDSAVARAALLSVKQPTSPLFVRILADLQGLNLAVIHVSAKYLALADGLSRDPAFGEDESERRQSKKKERVTVLAEEEEILMTAAVKSERFRERLLALQLDDDNLSDWFEIAMPFGEGETRGHLWASETIARKERTRVSEAERVEEEVAKPTTDTRGKEDMDDEEENESEMNADEEEEEERVSDDDATPLYVLGEKRRVQEARVDETGLLWLRVGTQTFFRLAVPRLAVRAIVTRLHAGSTGRAHWHARRCLLSARSYLYWPTMSADIVVHIQECVACQRTSQARPAGNLGDAEQLRAPTRLEGFEIDIAEFEGSAFLVSVELFSGFTTVMSLPDKTTASVISALKAGVLQTFGPPAFLQADGGAEFRSRFQQWCLSRLIEFRRGFPRNSMAQARVERANGTLRSCFVRARAEGAKESASDLLVEIAFEMNNAPTRENEFISPQLLLIGVPARTTMSALMEIDLSGLQRNAEFAPLAEAVNQQQKMHNLLLKERQAMRDERHEASKKSFAARRGPAKTPQPGDLLWAAMRKDVVEGSKHDQRLAWFGPYECLSFDDSSGRVELRYNGDVGMPFEAMVHVRETRPFVEAQQELPDAILEREGEFRKEQSQSPDGPLARGFELVPATVRERLQAAALAADVSRGRVPATGRPAEVEEADEQAVLLEARAIVSMERALEGERATVMMSDGSQRLVTIGDWRFLSPELKKLISQFRAEQREERRKTRDRVQFGNGNMIDEKIDNDEKINEKED